MYLFFAAEMVGLEVLIYCWYISQIFLPNRLQIFSYYWEYIGTLLGLLCGALLSLYWDSMWILLGLYLDSSGARVYYWIIGILEILF